MQIIVKNYEHYNKAFPVWDTPKGKYIKSRDHYEQTLKEQNMVPEEKRKLRNCDPKPYIPSKKALEIMASARNSKEKNGKVRLSDRTIDALQGIGAINKKIPEYMNVPDQPKAGFGD